MLAELLNLDVPTLIKALFWGHLVQFILTLSYRFSNRDMKRDTMVLNDLFAWTTIIQALAFFLLQMRGSVPDLLSVNLGNSLLLVGFYFEGRCLLDISDKATEKSVRRLAVLCAATIVVFNIAELVFMSQHVHLRVVLASICVFLNLIVPVCMVLFSKNMSLLKRMVGGMDFLFLTLLLPRIAVALADYNSTILSNSLAQSLCFLSLVLTMVFNSMAYMLLAKERQEQVMRHMAHHDQLTGLPNRTYFLQRFEKLFARGREEGTPMAILFFDLDHFKEVNDTYGHLAGDEALVRFCRIVSSSTRFDDLTCRYGGEEVVVALSNTTLEEVSMVADRICDRLRDFRFSDYPNLRMTVSVGMRYGVPTERETVDHFINAADAAMYEAKAGGRDCVREYPLEEE